MSLTDEQWAVIQPLLPPPSPALHGRPPLDDRLILDSILWKFRTASPWYDLPHGYPSYQTCYRRYRQWRKRGILSSILAAPCANPPTCSASLALARIFTSRFELFVLNRN